MSRSDVLAGIEAAQAYSDGRAAGRSGLALELAPKTHGDEWRRGWHAGTAEAIADAERQTRSVKFNCRYEKRECSIDCGGRGLCLDVA